MNDETLRETVATYERVRKVGFPEHRGEDECYCDTCWSYLAEDNGSSCVGCGEADDHQQTCIRGGGIP